MKTPGMETRVLRQASSHSWSLFLSILYFHPLFHPCIPFVSQRNSTRNQCLCLQFPSSVAVVITVFVPHCSSYIPFSSQKESKEWILSAEEVVRKWEELSNALLTLLFFPLVEETTRVSHTLVCQSLLPPNVRRVWLQWSTRIDNNERASSEIFMRPVSYECLLKILFRQWLRTNIPSSFSDDIVTTTVTSTLSSHGFPSSRIQRSVYQMCSSFFLSLTPFCCHCSDRQKEGAAATDNPWLLSICFLVPVRTLFTHFLSWR